MAEGVFTYTQLSSAYIIFSEDWENARKYVESKVIGAKYKVWSWKEFRYIEHQIKSLEEYSKLYYSDIEPKLEFDEDKWNCWAWKRRHLDTLKCYMDMAAKTADKKLILSDDEIFNFEEYL